MKSRSINQQLTLILASLILVIATACTNQNHVSEMPLPSWNDGPAKEAILKYVADVTDEQGNNYIPAKDRIATFDNDGTLWSEQPVYF